MYLVMDGVLTVWGVFLLGWICLMVMMAAASVIVLAVALIVGSWRGRRCGLVPPYRGSGEGDSTALPSREDW